MDVPELTVLSDDVIHTTVKNILFKFCLDHEMAKKIRNIFISEMKIGLKYGLNNGTNSLQMENTFVTETLCGSEEGIFLALDLGGTNFRIILLELKQGIILREDVAYYSVSEPLRTGCGSNLFDFLASCILDFVLKNDLNHPGPSVPLGFTFSFPMSQKAIDVGILVSWTKSFCCSGVVGRDVVKMLVEALRRIGSPVERIEVVAVLNDTTGTLIRGSYDNKDVCMGLIFGTGCNVAYLEPGTNNIFTIVDSEIGAFGDNGCIDFIKTEFDLEVDRSSLLPNQFTFEKYFSGKYVGRLCRFILLNLAGNEKVNLFSCCDDRDKLTLNDNLDLIEAIHVWSANPRILIDHIGIKNPSLDDVRIIDYVQRIIQERTCFLVGIPLAVFLDRMQRQNSFIAVTGSLFEHNDCVKTLLEKYIRKMILAKSVNFELIESPNGSGKGAGLLAAVVHRIKSKH